MGWAPASAARSLAESKTNTFGMVFARDPQILGLEAFYMQFLAGLETELSRREYGLLLQVVPDAESELRTIRQWRTARRVDGIILVDVRVDDPRVAYLTENPGLPAVAVGDPAHTGKLSSVWTNDGNAMRAAVQYLAGLGHRRIAWVGGPSNLSHTLARNQAFLSEAGRLGCDGLVFCTDYSPAQGAEATKAALETKERPTAFIYDNDIMAMAGLAQLSQAGLGSPGDVSVVAWDDSLLCQHTVPTLTALSHDVAGFGAHVARRLFDVLGGAEPASFLDSTPWLQPRGSTGPVSAQRT